jgi:hypothetical protein
MRLSRRKGPAGPVHAVRRTGQPGPRFNYELFNCNNFNIRYWSWNYRGCWPFITSSNVGYKPQLIRTCQPSRDGRSCWQPPFRVGMARPLSQLRELADTFPRSTQAMIVDRSAKALLGISIALVGALASPDPGCLAGTSPSN